jgi:hypothetical protein
VLVWLSARSQPGFAQSSGAKGSILSFPSLCGLFPLYRLLWGYHEIAIWQNKPFIDPIKKQGSFLINCPAYV